MLGQDLPPASEKRFLTQWPSPQPSPGGELLPHFINASLLNMGRKLSQKEKSSDDLVVKEFGGAMGAAVIIPVSHITVLYVYVCLVHNNGALLLPNTTNVGAYLLGLWDLVPVPTYVSVAMYFSFISFELILQAVLPGPISLGRPLPQEDHRQLRYVCNGYSAWIVILLVVFGLHWSGWLVFSTVFDHLGPLLVTAMLAGDLVAIVVFVLAHTLKRTCRLSGNVIYDFFMGAWLNPRLGQIDLKMWAEIRVSWTLLSLITLSAALKQYESYGTLSTPMLFMCVAHGLYTNATQKGEHLIPVTWDIFYEKWGWMLVWWNLCGVPFVYCAQSVYIATRPPFEHGAGFTALCFVVLCVSYFVWDTANGQKDHFRMEQFNPQPPVRSLLVQPQLPWVRLERPRTMKTEEGSELLIDGWYRYARKLHYTADFCMALSWGLICGFEHFIPYFYAVFFFFMIVHRYVRDNQRCQRKYGQDWDKYRQTVKYVFVPGLI